MNLLQKYEKFFVWWISILLIGTSIFWLNYTGIIEKIWVSDTTMITSVILAVFIGANIILGYLSYSFSTNKISLEAQKKLADICWFTSEQLLALGMLGTVIGLIHMLSANFLGVNLQNPESMQSLLGNMWQAMGLALYTNAVGLVFSIVLKVQVYYVGHELDET